MDGKTTARALAGLRVVLGWGFLYAGLAKFLMIDGGKPFSALGYLKFGTGGTWPGVAAAADGAPPVIVNPTHDLWVGLAGNAGIVNAVNFLVVFGEIAIGACLILGLATRFSGLLGALMMGLFTVASWDFAHGLVNETLIYTAVALVLAATRAGKVYGLDGYLEKVALLRRSPAAARFASIVA
jgi:thiosulfate dehydrogenase [quinone] large subunit